MITVNEPLVILPIDQYNSLDIAASKNWQEKFEDAVHYLRNKAASEADNFARKQVYVPGDTSSFKKIFAQKKKELTISYLSELAGEILDQEIAFDEDDGDSFTFVLSFEKKD